jgi:pimeloyl-ACP methyl ester carboxylesterase/uncharacterized membrane protein YidH (DUF202 family)
MPVTRGGQASSGLDRALENAFDRELDDVLESGELWPGELGQFPRPLTPVNPAAGARAWQHQMGSKPEGPGAGTSLIDDVKAGFDRWRHRSEASDNKPTQSGIQTPTARTLPATAGPPTIDEKKFKSTYKAWINTQKPGADRFEFIDDRVGIVFIHGIGPQLAGQTLLDWARPIIEVIADWRDAHRGELVTKGDDTRPAEQDRYLTDPVVKANIDFSGETFPVVQVRVPGLQKFGEADPRGRDRRWIMTETWWAQEIRPPTLATMITWLGEQGGVGRIIAGIEKHSIGDGPLQFVAKLSLNAFVSVIVSFVLLVFLTLLGIARLIPFGPLKNAVFLGLAASFLTDWFGGARTLLKDQAQSANVRGRLVMTIKALRAYGCRDVVVVAHSGGTMVSWMTLTDPAWPNLRVQKLITIGEALNLGWRLENENPDGRGAPTLPFGNRMNAKLAVIQPSLLWRDFWGTHDPAPAGRPDLPKDNPPGDGRFLEEKVWNRMNILEDHGGYWDNDEQFVVPLVRELDVPRGDRAGSRFFDDDVERALRALRKQRVGLLALLRRVTFGMPVLAILAALTMTSRGVVPQAGDVLMAAVGRIPGNEIIAGAGTVLNGVGDACLVSAGTGCLLSVTWGGVYAFGTVVLTIIFALVIVQALGPVGVGPLWAGRWIGRLAFTTIDVAIGVAIGVIAILWVINMVASGIDSDLLVAAIVGVPGLWALGQAGPIVRRAIRNKDNPKKSSDGVVRAGLIALSALVLAVVLVGLVVAVLAILLVLAGNTVLDQSGDTQRFVLGTVLIICAGQLIGRLGAWRWAVWDARERRRCRRTPFETPPRLWVYVQCTLLLLATALLAIIAATGGIAILWIRTELVPSLMILGALLIGIAMLGVARDVVDADTEGRGASQGGTDGMPPVTKTPTGPAPGNQPA